jgi:FAD/FMN-containing dehydrogenase
MSLTPEQIADLAALVGAEHVRYAADLAALDPGVDPRNLGGDLWLRPRDTDEVAAILRYCHANHISVVLHGGRTGTVPVGPPVGLVM